MFQVQAQNTLPYQEISIVDGLPSKEIYWTHQSEDGYLWLCSDRGLIRYDGAEMKVFDRSDGLPGLTVFKCFEDAKKRMWFTTSNGGVFWLRNDSVNVPRFNEQLIKILKRNWIDKIYVKGDEIIMAGYESSSYYLLASIGDSAVNKVNLDSDSLFWSSFFLQDNGEIILSGNVGAKGNEGLEIQNKPQKLKDSFFVYPNSDIKKINSKRKTGPRNFARRNYFSKKIGNHQWFSVLNDLYKTDGKNYTLIRSFPQKILNIYFSKDHLILSLGNDGLVIFDLIGPNFDLANERYHFSNTIISHTYKDKQGVFWLSTVGNNLIKVFSFDAEKYKLGEISGELNDYSSPLFFDNDTLKVFTNDSLFYLDLRAKNRLRILKSYSFEGSSLLNGGKAVGWDKKGNLFVSKWIWNYYQNKIDTSISNVYGGHKSSFQLNDSVRVCFNFHSYCFLNNGEKFFEASEYNFDERVIDLLVVNYDHHFIATNRKLFEFKNDEYKDWSEVHPFFQNQIHSIAKDKDNIFFGSKGNGLCIFTKDGFEILDQSSGLISNAVNKIYVSDSAIYVGTDRGVNILSKTISGYKSMQGLAHDLRVTDIFETENEIVVQSDHVLTFFKKNRRLNQGQKLRPIWRGVEVEGIKHLPELGEVLTLASNQNDIKIKYGINALRNNKTSNHFKYRLLGLSDKWVNTFDYETTFNGLEPNDYRFELVVQDIWGNMSSEPLLFDFSVKPPWYRSNWFAFSIILLGILLLRLYLFLSQKQLKQSRELILANIEALKNQMNPHFIFNALNSVQYYIESDRKDDANFFLSKLSNLIRSVLSNSSYTLVSLEKEIMRAKDYLGLESLRLENNFEYRFEISTELNGGSYAIPPLILQPVIENAIWHGFSDIDYRGELILSFKIEEKKLIVEICDNGVGMEIEKWKRNPSSHGKGNSIGLANTVRRLKLLSKIEGKEYQINFSNQNSELKQGTRVKLVIPQ